MLRGLEDMVVRVATEPDLRQPVAEAALAGVAVQNGVPGTGPAALEASSVAVPARGCR